MSHWTTRGVGTYVAGEGFIAFFPRLFKPDGTKRAVIVCRGATGDHLYAPVVADCRKWAEAGFPIIHPDLGTTTGDSWGRDDALTKLTAAWTFMKNAGCKIDKAILSGGSGGTLEALNWARANPASVAFAGITIPALDIEDLHDNLATRNVSYNWVPADIETKYTNLATFNSVKVAKNPNKNAAELVGIPQRYWYSGDDTVALPTLVNPFVNAVGSAASAVNMGNYGHGTPPDGSVEDAIRSWASAYAT